MKVIIVSGLVLVALTALVHSAVAYPQLLDLQFENQPQDQEIAQFEDEPSNLGLRQKRVTCDLLSFSTPIGQLNDAACAANCLRLGRRGGRCNEGVCVCRN